MQLEELGLAVDLPALPARQLALRVPPRVVVLLGARRPVPRRVSPVVEPDATSGLKRRSGHGVALVLVTGEQALGLGLRREPIAAAAAADRPHPHFCCFCHCRLVVLFDDGVKVRVRLLRLSPVGNCIKIGLPGKSILRHYFQENRTSGRPFLLLSFPGRPIFIQFIPAYL